MFSALCEFPLFGGVMATDDDVLFVGVVGISKRREARVGLCLLGFGFLCQQTYY